MVRSLIIAGLITGITVSAAKAEVGAVGSPYAPKPAEAEAAAPAQDANARSVAMPWYVLPAEQQAAQEEADTQAAAAEQQQKSAAVEEMTPPLLEINFSQNRVYYDRALRQGVSAAEDAKSGVVYDVVSYVPADDGGSASRNQRLNEEAQEQLQGVVQQLRAQGIPEERIRVSAQPYPKMPEGKQAPDYHKVAVFVR